MDFGKTHDATSPHFPPFSPMFPNFPPLFLVAKRGEMGIARPFHEPPQQKCIFWGFWPKSFPLFHQKTPKNPIFPHFPPFSQNCHILNIKFR